MTYLFGATSITGWNLYLHGRGQGLIPFCNSYAAPPQAHEWRRFNLEDPQAYETLFSEKPPSLVIHCGGICDVDNCEKDPEWAQRINVQALEYFLNVLPPATRLVYVSSDHVFGGRKKPYDELSHPEPISVYGRTRVQAEDLVLKKKKNALIIRPGLPIGPSMNGRTGHLNWLQYRTKKCLPTTVVADEFRSAVWAEDLAKRIWDLAEETITGLRHVPATRAVSRGELADYLNRRFDIGARVLSESRLDRPAPHLGHVELATVFADEYAQPLPSVVPAREPVASL